MHQLIAVTLTLAVAFLVNARMAAIQAADGNWGFALGQLFFGPLVVFFLVHAAAYFIARAIRGNSKQRSFSASKLNYVAATVAILGVLGSANVA